MVHGTGRAAGTAGEPVVVERAAGAGGELVLRRDGAHYEIISNGVFLMDTRNGESERLLVRAAAEGLDGPVRILIGGLGVGFSLAEALTLPGVEHVTVVEREPAVIGWHATALRPWSAGALDDPASRSSAPTCSPSSPTPATGGSTRCAWTSTTAPTGPSPPATPASTRAAAWTPSPGC